MAAPQTFYCSAFSKLSEILYNLYNKSNPGFLAASTYSSSSKNNELNNKQTSLNQPKPDQYHRVTEETTNPNKPDEYNAADSGLKQLNRECLKPLVEKEKSRIRETPTLLTNADSKTNKNLKRFSDLSIFFFYFLQYVALLNMFFVFVFRPLFFYPPPSPAAVAAQ